MSSHSRDRCTRLLECTVRLGLGKRNFYFVDQSKTENLVKRPREMLKIWFDSEVMSRCVQRFQNLYILSPYLGKYVHFCWLHRIRRIPVILHVFTSGYMATKNSSRFFPNYFWNGTPLLSVSLERTMKNLFIVLQSSSDSNHTSYADHHISHSVFWGSNEKITNIEIVYFAFDVQKRSMRWNICGNLTTFQQHNKLYLLKALWQCFWRFLIVMSYKVRSFLKICAINASMHYSVMKINGKLFSEVEILNDNGAAHVS